jgi:hypothetical protein
MLFRLILSLFQDTNKSMEAEGRTLKSTVHVISQSSSGSDYCLHQPSASAVPIIRAQRVIETTVQSIEFIGHETEETNIKITITRQEIQELKNR